MHFEILEKHKKNKALKIDKIDIMAYKTSRCPHKLHAQTTTKCRGSRA